MTINYNVTGSERKRLVTAIAEILDMPATYKGAPTFAYEVGIFTIDSQGGLSYEDHEDSVKVENLLDELTQRGFEFDAQNTPSNNIGLMIEMPRSQFSDAAIANLKRLVESKSTLFKKAFNVEVLPIVITEDKISFPWFKPQGDAAAVRAYTHFVTALCEMAKTQKRINAIDKPVENEKYAFRCFLLRLGFIGSEYKAERKILLSKLTGSSAFKNPDLGGADDE